MGKSVGDLFINLGINGHEKTLNALKGAKEGLGDIKDMSFQAKAAIVGAFYALEKLFTTSGEFGIGMTNAKTLIGESSQSIQQYENAAGKLGIANGTMTQSLLKLKQAMVDLKFKGQAPEGMFWIHAVLGDAKGSDIDKYIEHPEFLFQRLREYAMKEKVPGLAVDRLKSFIGDQNLIARIMQGRLGTDEISKAPFLSDATISRLEKTGEAWNQLGIDIQHAFHSFASFRGADIAKEIDAIIPPALRLVTALDKLAEKLKVFELIGKSMSGWATITSHMADMFEFQGGSSKFGRESAAALEDIMGGVIYNLKTGSTTGGTIHNINAQINLNGIGPVANPEMYGKMISEALKREMKKAAGNLDQSTVK
jgi:hypothetical protein